MNAKPPRFNYADFEPLRNVALRFPGTEESTSHEGTPSIKVRGKLMCRLHDSGAFFSIRLTFELRDQYLDSHPEIFHLPEHFKPYPYIAMWLEGYNKKLLQEILEASWRVLASKKQIATWEAGSFDCGKT